MSEGWDCDGSIEGFMKQWKHVMQMGGDTRRTKNREFIHHNNAGNPNSLGHAFCFLDELPLMVIRANDQINNPVEA